MAKAKAPAPDSKDDGPSNFLKKAKWVAALRGSVLDASGHAVLTEGAAALAKALGRNATVTRLDLTQGHVGDDGAVELAQMLRVHGTLRALSLGVNGLTDRGGVALASALVANRSLTHISLAGNHLGDDTATAFAFTLRKNPELRRLDLSWNSIGECGAESLAESLAANNGCAIELGQNRIGDEGCRRLCAALRAHGTPEAHGAFALWQADVGAKGGTSIAELVEQNDRLHTLNVSWNSLGNSAGAIAKAMAVNQGRGVTVIRSEEEIKQEGAQWIAEGFRRQEDGTYARGPQTRTVARHRWLQDASAPACTVVTLNLAQNLVEDSACTDLAALIAANGYLRTLDLSGNLITAEGATKLFEALGTGTSLETLDLSHNRVGDTAIPSLAALLAATTTLTALSLQRNDFTQTGKATIAAALPRGSRLRLNAGALDAATPLTGAYLVPHLSSGLPTSRSGTTPPDSRKPSSASALSWRTDARLDTSRQDTSRLGVGSAFRGDTFRAGRHLSHASSAASAAPTDVSSSS